MRHPTDEYRDAQRIAQELEREHAKAKRRGYNPGATGSGLKWLAWALIIFLLIKPSLALSAWLLERLGVF